MSGTDIFWIVFAIFMVAVAGILFYGASTDAYNLSNFIDFGNNKKKGNENEE
jgi:hypothetical protein